MKSSSLSIGLIATSVLALAGCRVISPDLVNVTGSDAGPDAADEKVVVVLVINEIAANEVPDWFEIVNATPAPVQLDQFVFVDARFDFAKAVPFPAITLGPNEYYRQNVDGVTVPFKLASDEDLWIYRASDHAMSDGVDWVEGASSPAGWSYARVPNVFGTFRTITPQTPAAPNPNM